MEAFNWRGWMIGKSSLKITSSVVVVYIILNCEVKKCHPLGKSFHGVEVLYEVYLVFLRLVGFTNNLVLGKSIIY